MHVYIFIYAYIYTHTRVYIRIHIYMYTHAQTHTHTHTCIHMYFQAGNTAVERAQNAQTIDLLKGAGATMPEFPEEKKNDLLIEYAKKGATGGALMALQAGADVNHEDWENFSRTALHYAASKGHHALAQASWARGRTSTRKTRTVAHR